MAREDTYQQERGHLAGLTDEELEARFWALAQEVVDELWRDVGGVGSVAVVVHLVQVELDDDLLALAVADGAFAAALVEVDEDLVPGGFVGGRVADGTDGGGEHGGDGFGVGVRVVPPAGGVGDAVPTGGGGIMSPCDAAGLDAEGGADGRVGGVARAEGRLRRRGLGSAGDLEGGERGGAAEHGGLEEVSAGG